MPIFQPIYRLRKIIETARTIPPRQKRKLLDIGCADGEFSLRLSSTLGAEEIYGIDISQEAVKVAREKGIKAYLVDVDEEKLPFPDEYFDVIFCGKVIEHLFDPDHLLDEVYYCLRTDSFFILSTPNIA